MDAMVLQLGPVGQSSLQHGPWHFRDQRYTEGDGMDMTATLLQVAPAVACLKDSILKTVPKGWSGDAQVAAGPTQEERPPKTSTTEAAGYVRLVADSPSAATPSTRTTSSLGSEALCAASSFSFTHATHPVQEAYAFSFPTCPYTLQRSLKRRRAVSDVDGPHTASLGCKKRRLRKDLVTSRLSRPFSLPATHIIKRESGLGGDKRFLKLAAIMSARRMSSAASTQIHQPSPPSPSSLLRRAAVINRFRLSVKSRAVERGDDDVADLATKAALLQQNHGIGFVVGARFPVTSSSVPLLSGLRVPQESIPPFQLSLAAVDARPRPTSPRLKATDPKRIKLPPSPKIKPLRSPELRSARSPRPADLDDEEALDDDDVAFPTSEHESRYESSDEPDDVYADFGMIFGGGSADGESEEDDEDHYEDYTDDMDNMDGIPWTAR